MIIFYHHAMKGMIDRNYKSFESMIPLTILFCHIFSFTDHQNSFPDTGKRGVSGQKPNKAGFQTQQ